MTIYFKTDTGRVRESNQDAGASGSFEGGCWGIVCDGMGGAKGGDIASSRAVEIIGNELSGALRSDLDSEQIKALVQAAADKANSVLYDLSQSDSSLRGMGTTLVCAVVAGDRAIVSHAGDSRAYHIAGSGINCITKDHSMVQELVDIGRLTPAEARVHPRRNIITRALGVGPSVKADHNELTVGGGDMILLCSDGLYSCAEDARLLEMALSLPADQLCGAYIDEANNNGGSDNITALVIIK